MTEEKNEYWGEKVTTSECRISFPAVFEPNKFGDYAVTMLFPKGTDLSKLKNAVKDLVLRRLDIESMKDLPPKFKLPFKDGDEPGEDSGTVREEQKGQIVIIAKTSPKKDRPNNGAPVVLGPDKKVLQDQSQFYAGCYAYVSITPYIWKYAGKKGVSFFLNNIMKSRDGEPLANAFNPEDDFAAVEPQPATPPSDDDWM